MRYPAPDDLAGAPLWHNYVVAQVVQASLGRIPTHAHAIGVAVAGVDIEVRFYLSVVTDDDQADIDDIVDGLQNLVGEDVSVVSTQLVQPGHIASVGDGIRWTYLSRR